MRTSLRQTRTNPTRTSKTVGSSLRQNSLLSNAPATAPTTPDHEFYPAITHFTDAITALPRDFRRHTSLLKEVDAKAWAPEAHLQTLLTACVASKPPSNLPSEVQSTIGPHVATSDPSIHPSNADSTADLIVDNASLFSAKSQHDLQSFEHRKLFYNLRGILTEMMVSMDEKNHLINSANEDLSRHLKRLTTIYPHIADEVSEEARLGSLTHWAYIENKPPTRANAASSRREAAAGLAAMHDNDIASRSESRREAMLARKQRHNQVDSDFEDPRTTKRANTSGKPRRGEIAGESIPGLGISSAAPVVKRKRAEKPGAGGVAIEGSLSGVLGGRALSREPSQQEASKKRKPPTSVTTAARKRYANVPDLVFGIMLIFPRVNTGNSATNSPKIASSPLFGTFGKEAHRNSPVLSNARLQSSRARQNSTQGRPPSSTSNKNNTNGIGGSAATPELHSVSAMTDKSSEEMRSTMKEPINSKGERLVEEGPGSSINGANGTKGGFLLERSASKSGVNNLKWEEGTALEDNSAKSKTAPSPRLPVATSVNTDLSTTRTERERERPSRARSSKTSTPIVNTFAEAENHKTDSKSKKPPPPSSSRSARNKDPLHDSLSPSGLPPKRSHKKGAGLAAQAAALQAKLAKHNNDKADIPASSTSTPPATVANSGDPQPHSRNPHASSRANSSPPSRNRSNRNSFSDEEEEEPLDSSGEEPRYCYCQQVSYGEMVACDADDCPREWFHLECVGLGRAPGKNARWFCEECKERLRLGGTGGTSGGRSSSIGAVAVGGGAGNGGNGSAGRRGR